MDKKVLMSAIAAVVVVATSGISFAYDALPQEKKFIPKNAVNNSVDGFRHTKIKHHPTKAEMEAKKAEFEKRLNLTEEQKIQIENWCNMKMKEIVFDSNIHKWKENVN